LVMMTNLLCTLRAALYKIFSESSKNLDSFFRVNFAGLLMVLPFSIFLLPAIHFPEDGVETLLDATFGSIHHFFYNLASLLIVSKISVVTHSIGNVMKRLFVISLAVVYYQLYLRPFNQIGVILALFGLAWYSFQKTGTTSKVKATQFFGFFGIISAMFLILVNFSNLYASTNLDNFFSRQPAPMNFHLSYVDPHREMPWRYKKNIETICSIYPSVRMRFLL